MFQYTQISMYAGYRGKSSKPHSVLLPVTLRGNPKMLASESLVGVSSSWTGSKGGD